MLELDDSKAEAFLMALEAALGGPGPRSAGVLAEVRGDLEAAVADAVLNGQPEDEAWTRALDELGDPVELAAAMRGPLPPEAPAPWVLNVRRGAAVLLVAWTVMVAWSVRGWDYGHRFGLFSFLIGLHLPIVLLLWPGIVWRWNLLFSTATAGAVLVLAWFVSFGASRTEVVHSIPEVELAVGSAFEEQTTPPPPSAPPLVEAETLAALLALAFVGLVLSLVQQRGQRRRILLGTAVLVLGVDLPHTIEERLFVREARAAAAWVEAERERTGALPTEEEFAVGYEPLRIDNLHYYIPEEGRFSLLWSRATQRTSELGYRSDGTIWGND